jgi:polyisoprenyl-teichoic acid--peptidoglycan teichoic acid transferase
MNKKVFIFLTILFVFVFCIVFFGGSAIIKGTLNDILVTPFSSITPNPQVKLSPTPTPDPLRPISILLLGYGGGKHEGGLLTDSMILTIIDPKKKKTDLISIPRDIWVNLPLTNTEMKSYKINAAYAIGTDDRNYTSKPVQYTGLAGGGMMSKYAVNTVTGINVDYFVSLDFEGFVKAIDSLNGIDINVPASFTDPWYPLPDKISDPCGKSDEDIKATVATLSGELLEHEFSCRYETLQFDKGISHMDGSTALKFVRSRHSPTGGNDFGRSTRQRAFLMAIKDKIFQVSFIPKIIPFMNSFKGNLLTDLNIDEIKRILSLTNDFQNYDVKNIALSTDNILVEAKSSDGQYILTSKEGENIWGSIHDFLKNQIDGTESGTIK